MKKLYKYRSITKKNLSECFNLNNLINNIAIFSSRKRFNDIFDSKIHINMPTFEEFKKLETYLKGKELQEYRKWKKNGSFSKEGNVKLVQLEKAFYKTIDSYPIYCLSGNCQSNLMWSHYADSHRGFCIEFNFETIPTQKIIYESSIPTIDILPMIRLYFKIGEKKEYYEEIYKQFGEEIHKKLHIKLNDWVYEDEYRIIFSCNDVQKDIFYSEEIYRHKYNKNDVNGIIFGCRMTKSAKKYILDNTEFSNYYQALERKEKIDIVTFNSNNHM